MKTFILIIVTLLIANVGCARVQVQAPKEPIKVDISMRLDVYQHVEKDIDAIENLVTGAPEKPQSRFFNPFVTYAHAADLSPEVETAALRRRDRRPELVSWQSQGVVGENRNGLLEIRDAAQANDSLNALILAENSDRMIIYTNVAENNGTSVSDVQKVYALRLQGDAPGGTPVQAPDGTWTIK